jgi:hypothetical protein
MVQSSGMGKSRTVDQAALGMVPFFMALFELGAQKVKEVVSNPSRDKTAMLPQLWYDYLAEGETAERMGPNRDAFYGGGH